MDKRRNLRSSDSSTNGGASVLVVPEKPLRADALRNRDALVVVARDAFGTATGSVPLEDIARDAGVGIGTLYRHFPTREALVEVVYSAELDEVVSSAATLLSELAPEPALRAWMRRYAEFSLMKRGIIDTLRAGWASGRIATPATRERISGAIGEILAAGAADRTLRPDITADDVTTMILGVVLASGPTAPLSQMERLLEVLVDGLLPR
jgi:AcrR family transcriptional regulator